MGLLDQSQGHWHDVIGGTLSMGIRAELMYPGMQIFGGPEVFNTFVSAHGLTMIFFAIMPAMIGGFGNWMVPLMIGAPDIAFPRMNNISFWLLPTFSKKPILGYLGMAYAMVDDRSSRIVVWAHHMFVAGIGVTTQAYFAFASYVIAVPTGIKIFSWTATMYGGSLSFRTPMSAHVRLGS
jgi:heme/copper-type cytochrome/quinol oxidase subunit 1